MEKIFLETSFFIRYFTADDKEKFEDCRELLEATEKGRLRPYTSNIVLLEILFVLTKVYKFSKKEALEGIKKVIAIRNLTLVEKSDSEKAFGLFEKYNIKYADCLISTQVPKGVKLVTYDEEFSKIKNLILTTPRDFVSID